MAWVLGLTPDQFYALSPRQLHLLIDRHWERVRHQELLAGIISAEIRNNSQFRPTKAAIPRDFMPYCWDSKPKRTRTARKDNLKAFDSWVEDMRRAGRVVTTNA
jgi:hypothetical protein